MPKRKKKIDPELEAFKNDLLRSIKEMQSGQFARITTPEEIASWNIQPVNGAMPSKPAKSGKPQGT